MKENEQDTLSENRKSAAPDPAPSAATKSNAIEIPQINLPKGGGAIKGIDEKFSANAANGTSSVAIPLPLTPAKGAPSLSLSYSSGSGNSVFGLGWSAAPPSIQRKTDKQLPRYADADESDVFQIAGAEDLVPALKADGTADEFTSGNFRIKRYRPRIEGSFTRIERIRQAGETVFYWRVTDSNNNVTFYGSSEHSRISDPENPSHVFRWLPVLAYDDKGSVALYDYKNEEGDAAAPALHDKNRYDENGDALFTNRYLKSVRYGNRTPFYPAYVSNPQDLESLYRTQVPANMAFYFETVFDYGEHGTVAAQGDLTADVFYNEQQTWPARSDAFSEYRAGFEIRTLRLCRRVLMFHLFEELGNTPCLVRSLDLSYSPSQQGTSVFAEVTYLVAATLRGYTRQAGDTYYHKALPAVEYNYQPLAWQTDVQSLAPDDLLNLPEGIGGNYQLTDLYGEGIPGILHEDGNALYYKSNLGDGHFTAAKAIAQKPSFSGLSLQDLEADGTRQLVSRNGLTQGFFEINDKDNWERFVPFEQIPNLNLSAPNVLQLDLDGDGRADLLVTEETVTRWYPSEGRAGYRFPESVSKAQDEEKGPVLIWNDEIQRIFLADFSGDGLTDLVRIRNGEICYWPNLGYGRFGKKVTMEQAPVFSHPDQFNPHYLHLADLTGTGASDVLYLDGKTAAVWLNFSGNSWSEPVTIALPDTVLPNQFTTADLLGNGTTCIVWSSPLPGNVQAPLRYIDLTAGVKPHLLFRTKNNMGKETTLTYKSSTRFYLEDKRAGQPWKTKLPFPVHCLWKTEVRELVTNMVFVSEYSYHHGYYDHAEREFRGFGRVDQKDTETFSNWKRQGASNLLDEQFHEPVVLTRTWFHTGAVAENGDPLGLFSADYWYNNPELLAIAGAQVTPDPGLPVSQFPSTLSPVELREAYRACKGMMLRQEVFSLDAPEQGATDAQRIKAFTPYSVAVHNCQVQLLQKQNSNRYAVFLVHESEALSLAYERTPADARISHTLHLEIDQYGNALKSVAVVYGRQLAAPPVGTPAEAWDAQKKMHLVLTEATMCDDDFTATATVYRLPASCEMKTFELTGVLPQQGQLLFAKEALLADVNAATETGYEFVAPNDNIPRKRLIEQVRSLFLADDLASPRAFKKASPLGMTFESYQLAFTLPAFRSIFPDTKIPDALIDQYLAAEGKYMHFDDQHGTSDAHWWIRSGTMNYLDAQKAPQRFYHPAAYKDPWGSVTSVLYHNEDNTRINASAHWMLLSKTQDAVGNEMTALDYDFRFLQPVRSKDMNDNLGEIILDDLGMVVASATLGKGNEADSLDQLRLQLLNRAQQEQTTQQFFNLAQETDAVWLLQDATSRFVYDFNTVPVRTAAIVRERHVQDLLQSGDPLKLQYGFEYTGGGGNVVMKKARVTPGDAWMIDAQNKKVLVHNVNPRWIGNGRTVMNNKGKPVKQYEPYFSTTHQYESDKALTEIGISPLLTYDSAGRLVRTDFPDGTFSCTTFDAWSQQLFDQNDNVLNSSWYAMRMALSANDPQRLAAVQTELHADTPSTTYLDSLGRTTCSVLHNRWKDSDGVLHETFPKTHSVLDIEGNVLAVIDARNNTVMQHRYDILGHSLYQLSMDAGERWLFPDIAGKMLYSWDSRNNRMHSEYDVLHRPTRQWLSENGAQEKIVGQTIYGEIALNPTSNNLRGRPWKNYDQSGLTEIVKHDFSGNLLESNRRLTSTYDQTIYWPLQNPNDLLEQETFHTQTVFDALGRPTHVFSPDTPEIIASEIIPSYDESGKLAQVNAKLRGSSTLTPFVKAMQHNEKGQRLSILYGNDIITTYDYEPDTFRMKRLQTTSNNGSKVLQDLNYVYDPLANIITLRDDAQQSNYFNNAVVEPSSSYEYDALYRLIRASGREHIGQNQPVSEWDSERTGKVAPGDGQAMQRYDQQYVYDIAGNLLQMIHNAGNGNPFSNQWTRNFDYATDTNRLNSTTVSGQNVTYEYNAHGSMTKMPHLQAMDWNFSEHLAHIQQGTTHAYYNYDASGQRTRKVVEKQGGLREVRIYLGGFEIFRRYSNNALLLVRESLHVMDNKNRIALIDFCTTGNDEPPQLIRYQFGNHLGSASLETDEFAAIISYEEYHPYGTTSWQSGRTLAEVKLKRYRYTGMERDEESGLNYHSARYYAPWLARWTATDPIGIGDGLNVYAYVGGSPIIHVDLTGTENKKPNPSDEAVMMKTDPQLFHFLKNMRKDEDRYNFLHSTSGLFRIRTEAMINRYKMGVKEPEKPKEKPKEEPKKPERETDEHLVIVGSIYDEDPKSKNYKGNALVFAMHGIRAVADSNIPKKTVLIFAEGYTKKQLESINAAIKDKEAQPIEVHDKAEIIDYISTGGAIANDPDFRTKHKIARVDLFSHGLAGVITLALHTGKAGDAATQVTDADLKKLPAGSFDPSATAFFGSCRTGLGNATCNETCEDKDPQIDKSLAQVFFDTTGIKQVDAFVSRTTYKQTFINYPEDVLQNIDGALFSPHGARGDVIPGDTPKYLKEKKFQATRP